MIALVAAVPMETEMLRRSLAPCEVRTCGRRELYRGKIFGRGTALIHTGIGKANAAAATISLLESIRPSAVLSFGCGGAYPGSALAVGDLALATEEIYGDEGVITPDGFQDLRLIGFPLVQHSGETLFNHFPVDPFLLEKARPVLQELSHHGGLTLAEGPFVTVSTCSGTEKTGREMAHRTGGLCENMEGAAVAQICAQYGVPFLAIRGISNLTEDRDLSKWDLQGASRLAQRAVQALLCGWDGKRTA